MANICVFAGATKKIRQEFFDSARELGRLIGEGDHTLIYGGGRRGLMGCVAKSALEYGGDIVEILPRVFANNALRAGELIITENLRDRVAIMWDKSKGYVVMPGGFGTNQEVGDVLATNLMANEVGGEMKPLAFLNVNGFYDLLLKHFENMYKENFAIEEDSRMYFVTESPSKALDYIMGYKQPKLMLRTEHADE